MKKTSFLIGTAFLTLFILLSFLLFWQSRHNLALKQQLDTKRQELKQEQSYSQELERLVRGKKDLKQKEQRLSRMVPTGERQPLDLIKIFISIGSEIGLRNVVFNIKETKEVEKKEQSVASLESKVKTIKIETNFEATFFQLLSFLEKLMQLERIVAIEQIVIKRQKDILPYQKVSLELITYNAAL